MQPGQRWLKRVVAEMGGKNAIVVDESADLDAAAGGIVASAYGFQGQKCSACSRVIALDRVHDALLERVASRTWDLRLGPARDAATDVAAVVDRSQYDKVLGYVEVGRDEGRLVCGGEPGRPGRLLRAADLFADIAPGPALPRKRFLVRSSPSCAHPITPARSPWPTARPTA